MLRFPGSLQAFNLANSNPNLALKKWDAVLNLHSFFPLHDSCMWLCSTYLNFMTLIDIEYDSLACPDSTVPVQAALQINVIMIH